MRMRSRRAFSTFILFAAKVGHPLTVGRELELQRAGTVNVRTTEQALQGQFACMCVVHKRQGYQQDCSQHRIHQAVPNNPSKIELSSLETKLALYILDPPAFRYGRPGCHNAPLVLS
jgi:hypothetical protein